MNAAWLLAVLPLATLGMTLVNVATWSRGRAGASFAGRVSVLIPARNEAANIERAVRAVAASSHPIHEILVYDDQSTDGTRAILDRVAADLPGLRVLPGKPLPPGWVGKPHACHRLAEAATGDVLVFLDADVMLAPSGLERIASAFRDQRACVVTAVPHQIMGTLAERLVLPFLMLTYVSWLPLALVARLRDPRVVAANGQVLAVERSTYHALGGFASVASEIVDDVAFCRHAKRRGVRVAFVDGSSVGSCRMYRSARAVWGGFSKNVCPGVGGVVPLLWIVALYLTAFFVPYVALAGGVMGAAPLVAPAAVGVGANVVQRAVAAVRWRQPWEGALLHPLGALMLVAIAANSAVWTLRGDIRWAGRSYARSPAARERSA